MAGRVVTPITALVTRPQPQADSWVESLRQQGVCAEALPLIDISAPPQADAVEAVWRNMSAYRALMFVSPAAVEWFFKQRPHDAVWHNATWAAAPGPGTAKALLIHGANCGLQADQLLTPTQDAAQFDSEHLWPVLATHDWSQQTVGILSGGDSQEARGRTWLTRQWQASGATVQTVLTYQRGPARWQAPQRALADAALKEPDRYIWLFSSSEALGFLNELTADAGGVPWTKLRALATHPRIGETARSWGIEDIVESRPDLDEVVQALRLISHPT